MQLNKYKKEKKRNQLNKKKWRKKGLSLTPLLVKL